MDRVKLVAWFAVSILCTGCASYAPLKKGQGIAGYSEKRLADGVYSLRFDGGAYDQYDMLVGLWNKRAEELCGPGNFTGTPENGATKNSVVVFSAGVVYPSTYASPHVEGRVNCNDKVLARRVGPAVYNPDDRIRKLALGEVKVSVSGTDKWLAQALSSFLRDDLAPYQVMQEADGAEYLLSVDVVQYSADGGGDSVLGALSDGTYNATSVATLTERVTGRALAERKISSAVNVGSEKEYILKQAHSQAIVDFVTSVFHDQPRP